VYNDAQKLFSRIVTLTKALPREYRFELGSQLIRSGLSIVLNIAEGGGKESDKELKKYLDISLGSAYETLACLDVLFQNSLIGKDKFLSLQTDLADICTQLGAFKRKIRRES